MRSDGKKSRVAAINRRAVLKATVSSAAMLTAPAIILGHSRNAAAQNEIAPFGKAKIDWRQAQGASITIGVIPAGYFDNLEAVLPSFKELTGINVRFEKTPPGQIRQKAVLDLSSKTATWASHAADPMYYPLYVANGWIDPLDSYLGDAKLTDHDWYAFDDILKTWRGTTSVKGKVYGIPYDGETTLQVYRTDVYEKLGLKPAETLEDYTKNAAKVNDPGHRL